MEDFESFISFLDFLAYVISEMFGSSCEVVVSDLDNPKNSVLSIYNGEVSGRKVGDALTTRAEELIERSKGGHNINYKKANKKEKKEIKSSTIVAKVFGRNISFCINYDCDDLTAVHIALKKFLSMNESVYQESEDIENSSLVEEQIDFAIEDMEISVVDMKRSDRVKLIRSLKKKGIFNIQKSVPIVAGRLGVSRYTIYNYLNEIEKDSE